MDKKERVEDYKVLLTENFSFLGIVLFIFTF